eukprot:TRINITY_DN22828_c0_g1_i3.p3 TRINITY_DN22828_c0_g1~~TRINITY_DN22828_c0_g1_i3.p3  ORF type:complete len:129 (-),score=9.40 TRINITY_DN22828_c0_g1_i3:162-548(-)
MQRGLVGSEMCIRDRQRALAAISTAARTKTSLFIQAPPCLDNQTGPVTDRFFKKGDHKPNSVFAAIYLAAMLPLPSLQPTLSLGRAALKQLTTWLCTGRGLHCRSHYWLRGELLPRHFTPMYLSLIHI